ncbi:hypothetical protein [Thalassotalea profundi]|uniref:DUF1090 family protein n=1 Tax=Thalassotalea profundi TaxID=2036687 RepID=A0ABQ3IJ10_9GAMM|nr:hypothetical protein [Thalassotalea profundi]GHE82521.1 hypothetical protein GCM10011501_08450 [Thalassotalea profundi]
MKYLLLAILFSICSFNTIAQTKVTKKSCAKITSKIESINKKMRNKYSVKQGESYREKLRKLYKKDTQCRKKRFKTK